MINVIKLELKSSALILGSTQNKNTRNCSFKKKCFSLCIISFGLTNIFALFQFRFPGEKIIPKCISHGTKKYVRVSLLILLTTTERQGSADAPPRPSVSNGV